MARETKCFHAALRLLKERDQAEDHHDFTMRAPLLLAEAERKRKEFTVLAEEWARATRHLSRPKKNHSPSLLPDSRDGGTCRATAARGIAR